MKLKSTFSPTDTAILAAFCMFLSLIEYMIPKPMPFMRIGLAHLPVMLSLLIFPPKGTLLLTLLKILGQGLVNGSLFSYIFLFSASGSLTSSLVMLTVYRLLRSRVSLVGVSVAGAMISNIVQILLARQFIFGEAAILIAPPFLIVGIVSSVFLGVFALKFSTQSEWFQLRSVNRMKEDSHTPAMHTINKNTHNELFPRFAFICGLLCIPALVFQTDTILISAITLLFILYSIILGKKFRLLPNLIMAAGIIAANLLTPHGRILAVLGGFRITTGALEDGIGKAALIIGLIYISRSSVRKGLNFPGRIGSMLSLVFYYFERLTEGERIKVKNIFSQLDAKLTILSSAQTENSPETAVRKTGLLRYIAAAIPLLLCWLIFAAGIIF